MKKKKIDNSLSIIVPVFNEKNNIKPTLEDLNRFQRKYPNLIIETIIVDDGSTDDTYQISRSLAKNYPRLGIKVYKHRTNKGPGAAFQTGREKTNSTFVTLIAADGQFNIFELSNFLKNIKNADLVIGYRINRDIDPIVRRVLSNVFTLLTKTLFNMNIREFNWVYFYRREKFNEIKIKSQSLFCLAEFAIRALRKNVIFKQIPSKYYERRFGKSKNVNLPTILKSLKEMLGFWYEINFVKN